MFKLLVSFLFITLVFLNASEEEYTFKAKGEFAKELKSLMEKYAKEGKIEIQKIDQSQISNRNSVGIVEAFLNAEQITGDVAFGKQIYDKNCFACHGEKAEKSSYNNARILSTLNKETLVEKLENYSKDATYGGSTKLIMHQAVVGMSTDEIVSVSAYIYSIKNGKDMATSPLSSSNNQEENSNEVKSSYLQ
jgi:cytochrome c553